MTERRCDGSYWIFPVVLENFSIDVICECSHWQKQSPELFDKLAETIWIACPKQAEIWKFSFLADLGDQEIEVKLYRDLKGNVWGIQYCGDARTDESNGCFRICPMAIHLQEKWLTNADDHDFETADFIDDFLHTLPYICRLPHDSVPSTPDSKLAIADFVEATKLEESQIAFSERMVVLHAIERDFNIYSTAVPIMPDTTTPVESPFELCKRWVKSNISGAFEVPLLRGVAKPCNVLSVEIDDLVDSGVFDRLEFDPDERPSIQTEIEESGTDALGWYQPYHIYDDDYWGIYLRTSAIHAIGSELRQQLVDAQCQTANSSFWLVTRMIIEHEYFHACCETFGLSLETTTNATSYRSNSHKIYKLQFGTGKCYEEAIANYLAYRKIVQIAANLERNAAWRPNHSQVVLQFFENLFDLSPPGYRDWRLGSDDIIWRKLANEARFGIADPDGDLTPLETALREYPPKLLPLAEVPLYLTDEANVGDRLFATPKKREVEKLLKQHGYEPKAGLGSHTKWVASTGEHFALPNKDPLSRLVFKNLLHHLGMTKKSYLQSTGRS